MVYKCRRRVDMLRLLWSGGSRCDTIGARRVGELRQMTTCTARHARAMRTRHGVQLRGRGLTASTKTLGLPFFELFRITARNGADDVVGVVEGFAVPPLRLLHIDSMRVFNSQLRRQRSSSTDDSEVVQSVSAFGVGLSLGLEAALYANELGCTKVSKTKEPSDWSYEIQQSYT